MLSHIDCLRNFRMVSGWSIKSFTHVNKTNQIGIVLVGHRSSGALISWATSSIHSQDLLDLPLYFYNGHFSLWTLEQGSPYCVG